ncbi:MAG: hypothetical protein Q4E12_00325 [Coriobacteriia bacterium]|nr:hypothetical protein [Coriobacteriia bacterium]
MSDYTFTLSSYEPVYAVCPEVRIAEDAIRAQAKRWLEINHCKNGEQPRLTDAFVKSHVPELKNVEGLMAFIRYNMYRDNREVQKLADQSVICAKLAERLEQDLPEKLVEDAINDAHYRLEDMLTRSGLKSADYCKQRGISEDQLYADVEERTVQSLKEDSALKAWAAHANYTLEPEDFYAIIPGDNIEDKAAKRRQMELEGRLEGMEEYARMTKALNEVMDTAMVKRDDDPDLEYVRYGSVSTAVMDAYKEHPEAFIGA